MQNFLIAAALVVVSYTYSFANGQHEPAQHGHGHLEHQSDEVGINAPLSGTVEDGVRVIEVKASQYKFEPDPIVVKLGEKVRLVVTSTDVAHGIALPDFNVNLSVPEKQTKKVEFAADKKGIFYAHCSVYCGMGHSRMHGSFIARE